MKCLCIHFTAVGFPCKIVKDFLLSFASSRGGLRVYPLWSQRHEGLLQSALSLPGRGWIQAITGVSFQPRDCCRFLVSLTEELSWDSLFLEFQILSLEEGSSFPECVLQFGNCCREHPVGETDISSMTELIKSLRRFLYRGFRNFKGWGLRGRVELAMLSWQESGSNRFSTYLLCSCRALAWARDGNLGR